MARLIDADALLAEYDRQHEGEPGKARKLIEDAPTIDRPTRSQFKRMAVQLGYEAVIHCRECKEHRLFNGRDMCAKNAAILDGREIFLKATRSDFFCAAGKRRTDE